MYLVELRPGKEELYRSSDELALAIRNGDVDARSRVYHRATAKWISITLHPQYKAIVSASKEDSILRTARRGWGLLTGNDQNSSNARLSGATDGNILHRWRRPLALGFSGLLLISGIQLAFSGPRPPWAGRGRVAVTRVSPTKPESRESGARVERISPTQDADLVSFTSAKTTWTEQPVDPETVDGPMDDDAGLSPAPQPAPPPRVASSLPRAPQLQPKTLKDALTPEAPKRIDANSFDALYHRYVAAHDSARVRLETGMRIARLNQLFSTSRLTPNGGVTDTRMSLAGLANFIRVYRQQQKAIEAAYQDSVTMQARQHGWPPKDVREWYSRPSRKESPGLEQLSGALLATIDSLLGVLDAQAGAYKIRGSAIAFEDPTASQKYGALRRRIKQQIDAAVAAGAATSTGPAGLLLQAIGTTVLPGET